MTQNSSCTNVPIYPSMSSALFFTIAGDRLSIPPEETVLEAELPSALIASCAHVAKATEEAVRAIEAGDSLRNKRLEVLRRLLVRKQVKDIEEFLSRYSGESCFAYVTRKPIDVPEQPPCSFNEKAVEVILEDPALRELGELALIAAVALSSIGRWIS